MLFGARVQKAFIRVDGSEESDAAQAALGILIGKPDLTKFEVDVIIRESTNLGNIVTENPLEDGTSIFDHVTNKPQTLDIEFIITDTPIGTLSFLGGTFSKKGRSSEEFARLFKIWKDKATMSIFTELQVYKNMMPKNIRGIKEKGYAVSVAIEFVEFKTVLSSDGTGNKTKVDDSVKHSTALEDALGLLPLIPLAA